MYVHVPFCRAKCSYCHFAIEPRLPDDERQQGFLEAVLTEVSGALSGPADTIYLGGGTPSLLSIDRTARLLDALRERFAVAPAAEVTLEANPRDLDRSAILGLRAAGVNRLSLGAQSFDDDVLREMGRTHTALDASRSVDAARAAGISSLSLDLILGWPGVTRQGWSHTLGRAISLQPDHLSLYLLEVEGRNLLSDRLRKGSLLLPDDDLLADLYQEAVDRLGAAGLDRYEISNFARAGHASRHNHKYWSDSEYLGFGPSAHSYRANRRFSNLSFFPKADHRERWRASDVSRRGTAWSMRSSQGSAAARVSGWPSFASATASTCSPSTLRPSMTRGKADCSRSPRGACA